MANAEPQWWGEKNYHSLNWELRKVFGCKVIKIPLNAGFTCPNRDGTLSDKGCLFCSPWGSGDFAGNPDEDLGQQFTRIQGVMHKKWREGKYIVYFQAFSNTYAEVDYLRTIYEYALRQQEVVGLAIATRPDCLPPAVLDLLTEFNKRTYLWVEMGLQTIHTVTARAMNLQYDYDIFQQSLQNLQSRGIQTVAHIILGLPGETPDMMRATGSALAGLSLQGLKIHLLHLMQHTPLAQFYQEKPLVYLTRLEYADLVVDILEKMPQSLVVHRLTGDGPRNTLIGPLWSMDKLGVLSLIDRRFKERCTWQGKERGS